MSKKIFSGKNSQKFWDAVNKSKSEILFEYGCKAQELEQQREELRTACEKIRSIEKHRRKSWQGWDSEIDVIAEAALAKS